MRDFFGLTLEYIRNIYEQFFYMKYYGGWSLFELYNLPVGLRNWYIQLLSNQKEKENEEIEKATSKNSLPQRRF
jgi:hypothetical protein